MTTTLLRTRRDGCYQLQTNSYGTFLAPADDTLADTVITQEQLNGFELRKDFPKIPYSLWERWIQLCIEMVRRGNSQLEVSCRLLRNGNGDYRIVVPQQKVTTVSVRVDSFDSAIDIETGEVITQFPPEGWSACGSSHSHNTMEAFFSGTDDQYELGDPGLHIVVGTIDPEAASYTLKASVTANRRRFIVKPSEVVELSNDDKTEPGMYHQSVLDVIQLPAPKRRTTQSMPRIDSGLVRSLDDEWSYYSRKSPINTSAVAGELEDVMESVAALERACEKRGLNTYDVLNELAFDIEDRASMADERLSDPFFYNHF